MEDLDSFYSGNVFAKEYFGIYGTFAPQKSTDLEYLLTNISIDDFLNIKTAADITEFDNVKFEEIIQRDIDYKRVDEELIAQYLDKQDDGVKFFPPLLISIIPTKGQSKGGTKVKAAESLDGKKFTTTFGKNSFQLQLNVTSNITANSHNFEGALLHFMPYASIKINPSEVNLVVIDGQHRFEALRRMASNPQQRQHIEKIQIPVCVFFTRRDLSNKATINKDLRELFVTINSKQKEVSGHFIVLLDDKRLSSHVVRALANKWKSIDLIPGRSALPLLEWNTRESRSAHQRLKKYSITTVSIIADCFSKYLFMDTKNGYTHTLLNLAARQKILDAMKDSPSHEIIDDETFSVEQLEVLKPEIESRIVEPLHVLLTHPRPYKELIKSFENKLLEFEKQAKNGVVGTKYYLNEVLYKYRKCSDGDHQASKDAETDFELAIKTDGTDDSIYFKLIFQHALLRSWATTSFTLNKYNVTPLECAEALTSGLDLLCFKKTSHYCEPLNVYTQGTLYNGQRIIQNDSSRDAWVNLIYSTVLNKNVILKIMQSLRNSGHVKKSKDIEKDLINVARGSINAYLDSFFSATIQDIRKNWRYKELTRADMGILDAAEGDPTKKVDFDNKVTEIAKARHSEAKKALFAALSINRSDVNG